MPTDASPPIDRSQLTVQHSHSSRHVLGDPYPIVLFLPDSTLSLHFGLYMFCTCFLSVF